MKPPATPLLLDAPEGAAAGTSDGGAGVNAAAAPASNPQDASRGRAGSEEREIDRQLVERARAGDQAAFRQLFERYHRRAYAVALSVVKRREDALDVVQDAFVKVHTHLDGFQGGSSFYTWLYRILMNLAIDHVRKHGKGQKIEFDERVARDELDVEGDGSMLPRAPAPDPGRAAVRKELSARLGAALDALPEYHREVIVLRELEGHSYEEMAEILGVPKGTIMSRLFHARRKMQALLADYLDERTVAEKDDAKAAPVKDDAKAAPVKKEGAR